MIIKKMRLEFLFAFVAVLSCTLISSAQFSDKTVGSPVEFLLALPQQNLDQLDALFWQVSDPTSPRYGKYLSVEELAEIVGSRQQDVEQVQSWITAQMGPDVETTLLPTRDYLKVTIRDPLKAHQLLHHKSQKVFPKQLKSLIHSVVRLGSTSASSCQAQTELRERVMISKRRAQGELGDPNSQKAAYGIPLDLRGTNTTNEQMVWGPCTFGALQSDLEQFYSTFGLPDNTPNVHTEGYSGKPGGDNFYEGTLDTEYISSMALGVKTVVANTNNSFSTEEGSGFGDALLSFVANLVVRNKVPFVLSMSLGSLSFESIDLMCNLLAKQGRYTYDDCFDYVSSQRQVAMYTSELQLSRINIEFRKLGLRGVTLLAATGDGGSHFSFGPFPSDQLGQALNDISCAYNFPTFPAASPFVLGVGGTQWSEGSSNPVAWTASGSGFSWQFSRPSYQNTVVNDYLQKYSGAAGFPPQGSFNASGRAYPDVSALADNVPIVALGSEQVTGGTSASTPEWAGIISLINDHRLNQGLPPLGFVNPRLYQLASQFPGVAFKDVTQGNSACPIYGKCCSTGFPATQGWDPVTGLGSPLFPGLLKLLGSDEHL